MNITVNIGRNTLEGPMPADEWHDFQVDVYAEVEAVGDVFQEGDVLGYWDGKWEDSYTVSAVLHDGQDPDLKRLRMHLAGLAATYGQDYIALITGEPTFIGRMEWGDFVKWSKARTRDRIAAEIDRQLAERGVID